MTSTSTQRKRPGNTKVEQRKAEHLSFRSKWAAQVPRVLRKLHGFPLPNNDAGRDLFALMCHAAYAGAKPKTIAKRIRERAAAWMPKMSEPEIAALIDAVTNRPRWLTRKQLGNLLRLTREVQMHRDVRAKDIWPIKWTHANGKEDRRVKHCKRSKKNRANKPKDDPPAKPVTKIERATRFVIETLTTCGPLPASEVMRLAKGMGLQPKGQTPSPALRDACKALGVVRRKDGLTGGWVWSLPDTIETLISSKMTSLRAQPPEGHPEPARNPVFIEGDLAACANRVEAAAASVDDHHRPGLRRDCWSPDERLHQAPCATGDAAGVDASEAVQVEGPEPLEPAEVYLWRMADGVGTVPIRFRNRRRGDHPPPPLCGDQHHEHGGRL